jgi:putative ABC transport system ATP-binding protein/macrolide transport system ATP-binding/permease protein/lipoprotein-releasing system ATP-binding protein
MSPTVRAFVQVGSSWQEVPLRSADRGLPSVLKITGDHVFRYTFEPDTTNFAQLLPYYMHIRFTNDMLISPSSQPKDDLVERSDSYYVYLKPHDANDAAILSKLKFPGAPPVWIAMPPH